MPASFFALLSALALTACAAGNSESGQEIPALTLSGRVVDEARILSPAFEDKLTDKLEQLEKETLVQLVVATTPDLRGHTIENYSLELANDWGVGSAERNDGVLLLVAPNERRVRIEVGNGLEASIKDEEAALIIQDGILPAFRGGNYETGIDEGVDLLITEVTPAGLKDAA